jgi:hypothetical protein
MKNALYVLVMFYYLAYGVRTFLNTIFFMKVKKLSNFDKRTWRIYLDEATLQLVV